MGAIRVLDDLVANQIAAGEVVERPASAVKELVENALDAGATRIEVRVKGGGLDLMEVLDNGCGIPEDEIETALIRHATSKLRNLGDFTRLRTLGFRGEALPSIASVSKFTLRTRTEAALSAVEAHFEGGVLQSRQPVGAPVGTRVQVCELFFNTPARLKFVRSLQTETGHIVDVVAKAALAHPQVAFRLLADERVMLQTTGDGQLLSVFAAIYGASVAKLALTVHAEQLDYRVTGVVGALEHARANRNVMWFAVNGRPIRSPMLVNTVLDGFGTAYHKGRFPLAYLALDLDPALVDVNVHPSKIEVRFSEEKDVRNVVTSAIRAAFVAGAHTPEVTWDDARLPREGAKADSQPDDEQATGSKEARPMARDAFRGAADGGGYAAFAGKRTNSGEVTRQAALWSQEPVLERPVSRRSEVGQSEVERSVPEQPEVGQSDVERSVPEPLNSLRAGASQPDTVQETAATLIDQPFAQVPASQGELRAVAQVLKMYIVAEDGDSVYLIDQHAAHERVLYERFRARLRAGTVREMELLVPLSVALRPHEVELVMRQSEAAAAFGLHYEGFAEDAVLVRSIPNIWEGLDEQALVREVFDQFLEEKDVSPFAKLEDKVIMSACKAAIKANQRLSLPEMEALLKALAPLENPFTCPHGRPTALKITCAELARRFFR